MEATEVKLIVVATTINAPIDIVWKCWTSAEDIVKWNNASDDWFTPRAANDLQIGGQFNYRMEAKDGSFGFDFNGIYNQVIIHKLIEYTIADGRKVKIEFTANGDQTLLTETFEAENSHPIEIQQKGWQAILDNFKSHTESKYHK